MNPRSRVIVFIVSALILYVVWYLIYDLWILPDTKLDTQLNNLTASVGAGCLKVIGFHAEADHSKLMLDGQSFLRVGNPCNGLEFFALFTGFIILFPGPWRKKFLFIPAGIILIFLLNITRVAILTLNYHFSRHTFDFNHKYTYNFFIYGIIFFMWMVWVNKFAQLKKVKVNE